MRRYPEWATYVGDNRYGDKLFDATPEGEAADYARARRELAAAKAVARDRLAPADQVSLDIFIYEREQGLRMERFVGFRRLSLGSLGGFQSSLSELLRASPVTSQRDAEQILARLAAYPRRLDQELAFLREGMALGWVPPRTVLDRVLAQLDRQLGEAPDQGPFFEPFGRLGRDIPAAERDRVAGASAAQHRRRGAAGRAPAACLRRRRVPGQGAGRRRARQLPRWRRRLRRAGPRGDDDRSDAGADPRHRPARGRAVARRDGRGASRGRLRGRLRRLRPPPEHRSEVLPRRRRGADRRLSRDRQEDRSRAAEAVRRAAAGAYGVRAMPADASADAAAYYSGPALDGSRAGWFNANAKAFGKRPVWSMETLVAHEAVPGHHLQIARAHRAGRAAEVSPRRGLQRVRRRLGPVRRDARLRPRPVPRSLQPLRPPAGAGVPGGAAGRRHRFARARAGAGSGRSTTWSSAPARTRPTSPPRSTATCRGRARRSAT